MILQEIYNRERFTDFITDFLPGLSIDEREIKTADTKSGDIESAHLLGESRELDLKVFEIKHAGTSKRRVGLTMEGFQIMRSSGAFRALIAFYSEADEQWRFSLMTLTPKRNEKSKLTIERSSPKRYSFVLGPNSKTATPEKFLISKGAVSDFEDLQSRFSLEVVNKDFYKKISELFTKLVGGTIGNGKGKTEYEPLLKLPSIQDKSQTSLEFAVRLIGRVIFCWFLREKKSGNDVSLMPASLLSHDAVKSNENYYHSVLEPIFFEVLNKSIKERKEKFTQNGFNSIPYLNGGLFTPHYDDFFHYNEGKQAMFNNTVKVPDTWLQEFFEFLETYNFTIDENISFDEELSIDPEMLGRIFENLLAEINPETGESARKSTGSYYTPRTIVDYMVDESLYAYLENKTGIAEEKIRAVISYDLGDDSEFPLNEDEQKSITEALHQIKILDPACGSGAFPMGMLQKIVFILQQTDPDGKNWFKKQIQHASPEIRRAIEREFENKNFDYIRKLGIIRENIFGVDIQPIATEISRLRCFLTLIVDESIDDGAENRGIEPLPNLDFKFVTANTLIGLPQSSQSQQQANLFEDEAGITELQELRDMFFSSTGAERDKLKFEFVQVQKRMLDHLIQSSIRGHAELTSKLTTWDPFSHQASSWFDPEWMFGIKEGFDIIIGNPPYITVSKGKKQKIFSSEYIELLNRIYSDIKEYKNNTFSYFIRIASELVTHNGILTYIIPNSFYYNKNFSKLRQHVLKSYKINTLIDIKDKVFQGAEIGGNAIFILSKNSLDQLSPIKTKIIYNHTQFTNIEYETIDPSLYLKTIDNKFFLDGKTLEIINKITVKTTPLSQLADFYNGIKTGDNKKFLSDTKMSEYHQPVLRGREIDSFNLKPSKIFVLFDKEKLWSNTNEEILRKAPKILIRQTGDKLIATIDTTGQLHMDSTHSIYNPKIDIYVLLALLNSQIMNWWHKSFTAEDGRAFAEVKISTLKNLPVKMNIETPLIKSKSNELFNLMSTGDKKSAKAIQKELDIQFYNIYDLNSEEIQIIEDSFIK